MKRCGDCRFFVPTVHEHDRTWFGHCHVTDRGRGHRSSYSPCSRFVPAGGGESRFPFHGPAVRDGCEWSPEDAAPAVYGDAHHASERAAMIVGAGGKWRLCASCAELPEFRRFRRRLPVRS